MEQASYHCDPYSYIYIIVLRNQESIWDVH